jgi:AAA domain
MASPLTPANDHNGYLLSYATKDIYTLDPPPLSYLVEGVVVAEALNMCVAREKTGKSLLALGASLAMARGSASYAGLGIQTGRVAYIDAENGVAETHRRIRRLSEMPVPPDRFTYLEQGALRFQLDQPDALNVLSDVIGCYEPDLIVFDSFRSLWGGDENRPREVAAVLDPLREFLRGHGVAGLLLHHANASGDTRGTTAIQASAENITRLTRTKAGERRLVQMPSRFGEILARPAVFRIVPRDETPTGPLDLVPTTDLQDASDVPPPQRDWVTGVEQLLIDGGSRSGRQIASALGVDPTHRGVRNAIKALAQAGTIVAENGGWRANGADAGVADGVAAV